MQKLDLQLGLREQGEAATVLHNLDANSRTPFNPWDDSIHFNTSVTNSSSSLIFVKIWAESGRIFSKNPGIIQAKIQAKLKFCDVVAFL